MRLITLLVIISMALAAWLAADRVTAQAQRADEITWGPPDAAVTLAGSYSGVKSREYQRIMDEETWRELWTRHAGDAAEHDSYGDVVVPAINFEKYMVIAIFNGEGWNTRNMFIAETMDAGELHIRFDAGTYQTADFGATPMEIEGEVTPEKIAEQAMKNMDEADARREANKHNDPNYTAAYGMWVLPRTLKPIVLIENVQSLLGEPPIWEEKHRFERVKK